MRDVCSTADLRHTGSAWGDARPPIRIGGPNGAVISDIFPSRCAAKHLQHDTGQVAAQHEHTCLYQYGLPSWCWRVDKLEGMFEPARLRGQTCNLRPSLTETQQGGDQVDRGVSLALLCRQACYLRIVVDVSGKPKSYELFRFPSTCVIVSFLL